MTTRLEIASVGGTEILVRLRARMLRLVDLTPELTEATEALYEATQQWYDSGGEGTWPELALSTVEAKAATGASDPERILYESGNLYQSATSASGPYSFRSHPGINDVVVGVDWSMGGWQIPTVLSRGSSDGRIPARPIWPGHSSPEYAAMRERITHLMMRGI